MLDGAQATQSILKEEVVVAVTNEAGAEGLAVSAPFQGAVEALALLDEVVESLVAEVAGSISEVEPLCLIALAALLQRPTVTTPLQHTLPAFL